MLDYYEYMISQPLEKLDDLYKTLWAVLCRIQEERLRLEGLSDRLGIREDFLRETPAESGLRRGPGSGL